MESTRTLSRKYVCVENDDIASAISFRKIMINIECNVVPPGSGIIL